MTDVVSSDVLANVARLERELQTRECRADERRLRELLAPDFMEIGASGRQWDLDNVVAMVLKESVEQAAGDISHRGLAPGVVQVFWKSERDGPRARRTSIWCEREAGWQQTFHQRTLIP